MRRALTISTGLALAIGMLATAARAEEFTSGPQVGDLVGAFTVVKAAGAADDGVAVGDELCYRCRMGSRPMVMVFAHTPDAKLASLVKQLDKVVADNKEKKMGSFVSLLGDKPDELKTAAKTFVEKNKIENIAFVVPEENKTGPSDYKLDERADVTVLIYREGKVAANHALAAGGLSDDEVKKIIADTGKILND
jgi:Cu/Ag efflux protein CusF